MVWQERIVSCLVIPGDSVAGSLGRPDKAGVKFLCCQQIEGRGGIFVSNLSIWHTGFYQIRIKQERR